MKSAWMDNDGCLVVLIDHCQWQHKREALGIPGLADEQIEVARLEAELDQAVADNILSDWQWWTRQGVYYLSWSNYCTTHGSGQPRLVAVQAAVAYAHELRATKERAEAEAQKSQELPDPANMTQDQRADELYALGWERAWVGPVDHRYKRAAWVLAARPGHGIWPETDESWEAYTIRALLRARELKAQEGKP